MATRTLIPQTTVAAATTITGDPVKVGNITSLAALSKFAYGAGGTATKVFIQTTLDGGTTWFDIVSHAFTTAAGVKASAATSYIAPASQGLTPGDAALTDNTIIQGVLGDLIRAKVVTTGTYTGTTHITVLARTV